MTIQYLREVLRAAPDATGYKDGARWDSAARASIHMPGHTAGHCVLLVEPEGVAYIGDIDLTGSSLYADAHRTRWLSPQSGVPTSPGDRTSSRRSPTRLARRLSRRNARSLSMLAAKPSATGRRLLYPPNFRSQWVEAAEERTIGQHLAELLADGRVR